MLLKTSRVILAILVLTLSSYGLITNNSPLLLPYMIMFLGCLLLVMGLEEFNKTHNSLLGYMLVGISLLCIYTSVKAFLAA